MHKMDAVGNIDDLTKIGAALGERVDLGNIGHFATA